MDQVNDLIANKAIFFKFMKEKYHVYSNSNLFFRDIQYAVESYFQKKEKKIKYKQAELIAREFIDKLVQTGDLKKISENAWKVNFSFGNVVNHETV